MVIEFIIIFIFLLTYFYIYTICKVNADNSLYLFEEELTKHNIYGAIMLKMPFYFKAPHFTYINKQEDINITEPQSSLIGNGIVMRDYKDDLRTIINSNSEYNILSPNVLHKMNYSLFKLLKIEKNEETNEDEEISKTKKDKGKSKHRKDKKNKIETEIETNSIPICSHMYNRNFYHITEGKCVMYLIHPKYRDQFNSKFIYSNINDIMYDYRPEPSIDETIVHKYIKENSFVLKLICDKDTIVYVPNFWLVYIETNNMEEDCVIELFQYKTYLNELVIQTKTNVIDKIGYKLFS